MNKKVVVLGGGTGMSCLIRGLKKFPLDITTVVSVCDDGRSTGRLRNEFNIPAVGDIRQILVSLSETEPLVEKLLNYRFNTTSDLNGHTVGNLLLTASSNITGNMSDGIETLGHVLNLKGRVLPLTEDNVTLMAKMQDGSIIEGEHSITEYNGKIEQVYYKEEPIINEAVLNAIKEADLIILSMGSLYTSIIPNLICKDIINEIDKSKAKIVYTCNIMTQPGETDDYKVSDHIKTLNKYLGKRKIDVVIANNGKIDRKLARKYSNLEQKDPVVLDVKETKEENVKIISENLVIIENNLLRHDILKLGFHIFSLVL
ncbi:MAG: uridine diphosphate-N-acetylglucosamine-binding protein YvcK [Firmicutes bacterium]|nr:uridine diphosphate-N-acetylglucosamine-binding protein YvcK [Bacillota bacterium]